MKNLALSPGQVRIIVTAYETARAELQLRDPEDPLTQMLAKKIIEIAQTGEHDATRLSQMAIQALRVKD